MRATASDNPEDDDTLLCGSCTAGRSVALELRLFGGDRAVAVTAGFAASAGGVEPAVTASASLVSLDAAAAPSLRLLESCIMKPLLDTSATAAALPPLLVLPLEVMAAAGSGTGLIVAAVGITLPVPAEAGGKGLPGEPARGELDRGERARDEDGEGVRGTGAGAGVAGATEPMRTLLKREDTDRSKSGCCCWAAGLLLVLLTEAEVVVVEEDTGA